MAKISLLPPLHLKDTDALMVWITCHHCYAVLWEIQDRLQEPEEAQISLEMVLCRLDDVMQALVSHDREGHAKPPSETVGEPADGI